MTASGSELRDALIAPLAEIGVDVEEVEVSPAGRRQVVRVSIDRDGGVDLDLVAEVSRLVGGILDEEPWASSLVGAYVLEVTSPGVDRPLVEQRHWRRAMGRMVRVEMKDTSVVEGRIDSVTDDGAVTIKGSQGDVTLEREAVARAVVQVEFQRVEKED